MRVCVYKPILRNKCAWFELYKIGLWHPDPGKIGSQGQWSIAMCSERTITDTPVLERTLRSWNLSQGIKCNDLNRSKRSGYSIADMRKNGEKYWLSLQMGTLHHFIRAVELSSAREYNPFLRRVAVQSGIQSQRQCSFSTNSSQPWLR